jgi:hypothetical protein
MVLLTFALFIYFYIGVAVNNHERVFKIRLN